MARILPFRAVHSSAVDTLSLPAGEQPLRGREAIRDSLIGMNGVLKWRPVEAEVAAGEDLGYTWGTYQYRSRQTNSAPTVGKYVTIWKKQPNGIWKAVLDCGNQNPPPR